jgi:hypothetical protein
MRDVAVFFGAGGPKDAGGEDGDDYGDDYKRGSYVHCGCSLKVRLAKATT